MKLRQLAAMAAFALVSCTQQQGGIQYMPFQESEKSSWGLIGADGTVLVNDEFKQMPTVVMHDRFFVKNKKGLWELYTAEAKPKQIGDEYSQAGVFVEDVAPVVEKDKQIEFIDVDGNVKFTLDKVDGKVVTSCTNFTEGVAIFKVDKLYGCINTKGDVIVEPEYIMIYPASEGKMLALDKKQEKYLQSGEYDELTYTILSTAGKEVGSFKAKRFRITDGKFCGGALVVTDDANGSDRRVGLVDEKGDWILKPSDKIKGIKDIQNKTFIFTDGEQQGVMDFEGKEIIRARYANIVFAGNNMFFAKPDKEKAGYQLMSADEKQIGKDEYLNVLPFMGDNAIVQESEDSWIFINANGEDLKVKQDVYCITDAAMGDTELQNEYFDFDMIVSSLNLTKDGLLDMNLNMGAQTIANAIEALGAGEDADKASEADPENYVMKSVAATGMAKNNIAMSVSATFDETMATAAADSTCQFKTIKPNQIGLDIPATVALSGKSKQLAQAIINRVKTLGQVVKENENAAIVKIGDASYFVANSGSHVYVVYGLLDINQINIDQYLNVKESIAEPIKSAAEEFGQKFQTEFADSVKQVINAIGEIGAAIEQMGEEIEQDISIEEE